MIPIYKTKIFLLRSDKSIVSIPSANSDKCILEYIPNRYTEMESDFTIPIPFTGYTRLPINNAVENPFFAEVFLVFPHGCPTNFA